MVEITGASAPMGCIAITVASRGPCAGSGGT
jgi:hypothetical protein